MNEWWRVGERFTREEMLELHLKYAKFSGMIELRDSKRVARFDLGEMEKVLGVQRMGGKVQRYWRSFFEIEDEGQYDKFIERIQREFNPWLVIDSEGRQERRDNYQINDVEGLGRICVAFYAFDQARVRAVASVINNGGDQYNPLMLVRESDPARMFWYQTCGWSRAMISGSEDDPDFENENTVRRNLLGNYLPDVPHFWQFARQPEIQRRER